MTILVMIDPTTINHQLSLVILKQRSSLQSLSKLQQVTTPLKEGCKFENPPKKGNYVPLLIGASDPGCQCTTVDFDGSYVVEI